MRISLGALVLVGAITTASAQEPARDWRATTEADARAFHAALQGSHPGPLDTENPGFERQLDASLARALTRARRVSDYAGYAWTMREFVASFDDGHVALATQTGAPTLPSRWPGFLVRYTADGYVVAAREEGEAQAPPLGARLRSCDGVNADALAERRIARTRGRWALESSRVGFAANMFWDQGDPFAPLPRRCVFDTEDGRRTFALRWREIERSAMTPYIQQTIRRAPVEIGMRPFGANGFWVSAGSFDPRAGSEDARRLRALITELNARRAELQAADRVVLDLRANNGGSSAWSHEIAQAIWGEAQVEARSVDSSYVEWRVSDANIAHIDRLRELWANDTNTPAASKEWGDRISAGLHGARDAGQALWRQTDDEDEAVPTTPPPLPERPRVYVVSDFACGSACLDALDLWRALGAIQIGQTTSADTVYMEVRREPLPSGLGEAVIPMKVYRGRPRGHNEPYAPVHRFDGDLADTAALEAWVATLP